MCGCGCVRAYVYFETVGCVYLSAPKGNRMHTFGSITTHVENASQTPADTNLQQLDGVSVSCKQ
jgi:hypothetical protein